MKALSQPLFASLQGYDRQQLGPDLFSGVLIALLSIPISMGYAQLAGLPPVYGLYGSLIPILLFAMLSTTREFIFGVDAAPAAMIGAVLASLGAAPGGAEAMRIVPVLTLYVALWLAVFALVRADRAVDYISEPVMGGFISGVCCEIILMQVPKLLGSGTGTGELFELLQIDVEALRGGPASDDDLRTDESDGQQQVGDQRNAQSRTVIERPFARILPAVVEGKTQFGPSGLRFGFLRGHRAEDFAQK